MAASIYGKPLATSENTRFVRPRQSSNSHWSVTKHLWRAKTVKRGSRQMDDHYLSGHRL